MEVTKKIAFVLFHQYISIQLLRCCANRKNEVHVFHTGYRGIWEVPDICYRNKKNLKYKNYLCKLWQFMKIVWSILTNIPRSWSLKNWKYPFVNSWNNLKKSLKWNPSILFWLLKFKKINIFLTHFSPVFHFYTSW